MSNNRAGRLIAAIALAISGLLIGPATPVAHAITSQDSRCALDGYGCTYYLQDDCDTTGTTDGGASSVINDTTEQAAIAAATAASTGGVTVGFALYNTANGSAPEASFQDASENYGASITKALLLIAYLNQTQAAPASGSQADTELTAMIEQSDNAAANWVYGNLKDPETQVKTAATIGGTGWFTYNDTSDSTYRLGQSQVNANGLAKLFSVIDAPTTITNTGARTYGLKLLSNLSSADQVGLLQAGLPGTVYSKEGWKPEPAGTAGANYIVNQAAEFQTGTTTYGVAVTVGGLSSATTGQTDGEKIIKTVVSALVQPAASSGTCCASATSGNVTLTGKDVLEQAFNALVKGLNITGAQAAGIMGNLMWESGGGTTIRPDADQNHGTATYPTADDGFGIAQWTPAASQQPLVALANSEQVAPNTLAVQLEYLIDGLTNNQVDAPGVGDASASLTALKATKNVTDATTSFMNTYEIPGIPDFPQRLSGAQAVYTQFGANAPTTAGSAAGATGAATGASGCAAAAGGGNASIVGTALEFAWPKPDCTQTFKDSASVTESRGSCFDATNAYQKGYDQAGGDPPMTDCGAYIASVMIASKADPNYPAAGTIAQYQYVSTHPQLYKIIATKSTSGLAPGDILVASNEADGTGHTAFYVGTQAGYQGFVADASWGGHTPQMVADNSAGDVAFILADGAPYGAAAARYIGTAAQVYKP